MRPWRRFLLAFLISFGAAVVAPKSLAQSAPSYAGRSVQEVIDELRAGGAPIVYSTNLLPPDLLVTGTPQSAEPLALAREILAPHGLTIDARAGIWLVVRATVAAADEQSSVTVVVLDAARSIPVGNATVWLDRQEVGRLTAADGRARFDGVIAGQHVFTADSPGYARRSVAIETRSRTPQTVTLALVEKITPTPLDELLVTASRYDFGDQVQPSGAFFTREQIENESELADDPLRVAHRLPGMAANEFSARSYVRGGDRNEMAIFFDGMELVEPFHFRDYQSLFSSIDQRIVSNMQIYSGGFPAAYGGALSGLSIIDARTPTERREHELGVSLLLTSFLSSGTFADNQGEWLVSARRGNIDQWLNDDLGEPSYRDTYVHVAGALGKHSFALSGMSYDDDILLIPADEATDRQRSLSESDAMQIWLRIDSDWTDVLSSRTVVSSTRFSNDRTGEVDQPGQIVGDAADNRRMTALGLRQDWHFDLSDRQVLAWGFETRQLDAQYDYSSHVELFGIWAASNDGPAASEAHYRLAPEGHSYSAYLSDRIRVTDRLVVDLGARWDKQTYLPPAANEQVSGRSSLLYEVGPKTDLRFSYGRFLQPEGLLELQVEDGVTEFSPAQDASHAIASVEHRFDNEVTLRTELFQKVTRSARPRFENLFDPFVVLPELQPGRTRIAPQRGESQGLEMLLTGERPVGWRVAYALSEADDIIDGQRVPRSWDQHHAVTAGLTWNVRHWTINADATYHTGWPTTELFLEAVDLPGGGTELRAVPGERNVESFDPLRRLDFAANRIFPARVGTVKFFAEATNLLGRDNPCCLEYELITPPGGEPYLERTEDYWLPTVINVGVLWEF